MPPVAAVAAAAGSLIGGNLERDAKEKAATDARMITEQAANRVDSIDVPTIDDQLIKLERLKSAGNLTPEMEATIEQKESELNAYKQNPEAYAAQIQALKKLQDISNQGGLTVSDRAQLNEAQTAMGNQSKQNRAAILQNFAQRGMSGSGAELAAHLADSQSQDQTASQAGFNVAKQAQERALAALTGSANLGQSIENQNFGQAQVKAGQQNAINQFNASNAQNVLGQNVQRSNYAQERNLNNDQQILAGNTGLANQEQVANKGLVQQQFQNQMTKETAAANALNKVAAAAGQQGQANADFYGSLGQAGAKLGTTIGDYAISQNKATPTSTANTTSEYTTSNDDNNNKKYKLDMDQ